MIFCTGVLTAKGDFGYGWECVKEKIWPTWLAAFNFWIVAEFVNYTWIPFFYRVIFDAIMGTFWGIFYTWLFHK